MFEQSLTECRICKFGNLEQVFENRYCPKTSHKYLQERELRQDKRVPIRVLKCGRCGMVQLSGKYAEDEYVSDYQRNITFSTAAQALMASMAQQLAMYGVKNVVEIGCGNGTFAKLLAAGGNGEIKVTAFEPSKAAYQAALFNGIDVHNRFFDETLPVQFNGFDGFAMRFVLEHLDDPQKVLDELRKRCLTGAVGLIEVPNGQKQFTQNRWFDYFPEHILYFTPTTLAYAMESFGFEVLSIQTTMQDEFLSAIVRVSSPLVSVEPDRMKEKFLQLVEGPTYVWGASGGCTTLLSSLFAENSEVSKHITCIVDSDVNKWSMFASGSKVQIVPPEEIAKNPPQTVIIMPLGYEKEIRGQLKNLGFSGNIRSLRECLSQVKE